MFLIKNIFKYKSVFMFFLAIFITLATICFTPSLFKNVNLFDINGNIQLLLSEDTKIQITENEDNISKEEKEKKEIEQLVSKKRSLIDFMILAIIATFIMLIFYCYYYKLVTSYIRITNGLNQFDAQLKQINNIEEFKNNYSIIGKNINKIPHIKDIWWEFCETFIIEREKRVKNANSFDITDNPIKDLKNTAQSEIYINKDSIINQQAEIKMFEATPGVLTGLGLAGTFIAITIALSHFNPKDLENSINALLSGLSIKFISSLAGIVASIWFLFARDILFTKLGHQLTSIQTKLNRIFPRQTVESYLARIALLNEGIYKYQKDILTNQCKEKEKLDEIYKEIEDQTCSLKEFLTDLDFSDTIKNAISEGLNSSKPDLIDAIDNLKESLNDSLNNSLQQLNIVLGDLKNIKQESSASLVETLITELKFSMENIQNSFTNAIIGDSNNTVGNLQKSLEESSQYISSLKDTFEDFMTNIQTQIYNSNSQHNEIVKTTVNETVAKVSEINQNLQAGIANQNTQLTELINALSSHTAELYSYELGIRNNYKDLTDNIQKALTQQENMINKNTSIINQIVGASEKLNSSSNSLYGASTTVANSIALSKAATENLSSSLQEATEINNSNHRTLKESLSRMENLEKTLVHNMDTFANKSIEWQNNLLDASSTKYATIAGQLSTTINLQKELIDELNETLEEVLTNKG